MRPTVNGRPTWATIDLAALTRNYAQVRRRVGRSVRVLAVVKADAYGHGAVACSRALAKAGADAFGVATVDEAEELRQAGIQQPIQVFGLVQPAEAPRVVHLALEPTVVAMSQVKALGRAANPGHRVRVQLKVDTGMGRIGLLPAEAVRFARQLKKHPRIDLAGVYTHFAHADGRDQRLLKQQWQELQSVARAIKQLGWSKTLVHAANSAAIIETPEVYGDLVRPGLMLYGLVPAERFRKRVTLQPVLSWRTAIIQLKTVPSGTGLSYGHTFVTPRTSRIATLAVGYADGFNRGLSNRGFILAGGQPCPIVGRVCMDLCLADVTRAPRAVAGGEVVLIGSQGQHHLSADDLARSLNTISYEVLCAIGRRVPRVLARGAKR